MEAVSKPRWPVWLFVATAVLGIASTVATIYYYGTTTTLQDQELQIAEKRAQYQAAIEELKKRLIVTRTVTQKIDTPVVTMERNCINVFGKDICTEVPKAVIESREMQVTVPAEDPRVKEQLDAKLRELQALSANAVATQQRQVDLKGLVDVIRGLVAPLVSLFVSVASIIVILSKRYKAESEKWAYGSLGTILGYWLK